MSVPRSCIGRRKWAKVGMSDYMFRETEEGFEKLTDNPHSAGADGPSGG